MGALVLMSAHTGVNHAPLVSGVCVTTQPRIGFLSTFVMVKGTQLSGVVCNGGIHHNMEMVKDLSSRLNPLKYAQITVMVSSQH